MCELGHSLHEGQLKNDAVDGPRNGTCIEKFDATFFDRATKCDTGHALAYSYS